MCRTTAAREQHGSIRSYRHNTPVITKQVGTPTLTPASWDELIRGLVHRPASREQQKALEVVKAWRCACPRPYETQFQSPLKLYADNSLDHADLENSADRQCSHSN